MFAVDDLDDTLARLRQHGAQLVDQVVQYKDVYRLCYVRGPEGILIGLAEQIGYAENALGVIRNTRAGERPDASPGGSDRARLLYAASVVAGTTSPSAWRTTYRK